jgi:hypothetical protein
MLPSLFIPVNVNLDGHVQIVLRSQVWQFLILEGVFFDVDVELSTLGT